jgi:urate oxidase
VSPNKFVLGPNQYGKAEVRLVQLDRGSDRHVIHDLNVSSSLRGDFVSAHRAGNNEHVVPTDTQKNTIFSFARDGITAPEQFLLRLGEHFTARFDWVTGGRWEAEQYDWERIQVGGQPHDHAFVKKGMETRTAVVFRDNGEAHIFGGLQDLTVLKSTASGFVGYPKDEYTTLAETEDRVLATDVKARWRYNSHNVDFNAVYASVKALLLEGFAEKYSYALQNTLFEMGSKALAAHPEIDEFRFSMPNKHHFVVDLSPFGQDNPNIVFHADDRPYGLIEGTVAREDAADAGNAWAAMVGFC